jgi:hypothetical protein
MRATPILALAILFILLFSNGSSFAQNAVPQERLIGIYAQIVVHDSLGNLIAYLETERVKVANPGEFNKLIDENIGLFKRSVINLGGQDIEILQLNRSRVHESPTVISLELISLNESNGQKTLVVANHDGYPVIPGDNVTLYWTIVRYAS